ncbi:MAG TPA: hypothetical protein VKD69_26715 [Vicinamibacterales bacterium]|nr:hypothetical protein [Vicinamibacterales bacterium]
MAGLLLVAGCSGPAAPSSRTAGAAIDVLDYLIGDAATWPRRGSHGQNQIVDRGRQEVCWTKYGNPRRFECWRWDDQFVYHAVDHALDGDSEESYTLTDGRWMPRFIAPAASAAAPWTLDVAANRLVWFDAACRVDDSRSHLFPYRLRAWIEPNVDGGGDIGVRETLVFEYEPYDPASPRAGNVERFFFARDAGWCRWQRDGFVDLFNRIGGPATQMNRSVWCTGGNF